MTLSGPDGALPWKDDPMTSRLTWAIDFSLGAAALAGCGAPESPETEAGLLSYDEFRAQA
jgi:hypothetical protein